MKNKALSIISWVLALLVLGFALVYYNFIDKKKSFERVEVGDVCPDFSVETVVVKDDAFAMSGEKFNLYENNGKVRVINFWATWCQPCVHELPYFNEFAVAYPDVEVVAVSGGGEPSNIVMNFMNGKSEWKEYSLTFALDNSLCVALGGTGMLPMTVVIDKEGIIRFSEARTLDFAGLESIVLPLLND